MEKVGAVPRFKIFFTLNISLWYWKKNYCKFDFLICSSDRSQCLEYYGMVDFAYKLHLHYNIYTLILCYYYKLKSRSDLTSHDHIKNL